ncbi:hypothetical protein L0244_17455 [bacterium]|nr:hypothetical protein [bacterium]
MNKKILPLLIFVFVAPVLWAQDQVIEPETASITSPEKPPERAMVKLTDFQTILMISLREKFPRLPGIFYSAHSCRLPEYGPVVTITLQLPAIYFTRPLLQELDRQKRLAEEQMTMVQKQIERQAEMLRLRGRESELTQRIQVEVTGKKRNKAALAAFQTELTEVQKNLKELEASPTVGSSQGSATAADVLSDLDLEKMLATSYKQLVEKITTIVTNVLAEKAPVLADLNNRERITVTAHIRESFVSSQERSIIFTLHNDDVEKFRNGTLDLNALKQKVEVRNESPEQ